MSREAKNEELPIQLKVPRTLLFYLSAKSKKSIEECACILVDLANKSLKRMRADDHGYQKRNKCMFPDIDVPLNATVTRTRDMQTYMAMATEWLNLLESQDFFKKYDLDRRELWDNWSKRLVNTSFLVERTKYDKQVRQWIQDNPPPEEYAFECLMCCITIDGKIRDVILTQHDIEHMLIESILLGGDKNETKS